MGSKKLDKKFTEEEVHQYLKQWRHDEIVNDYVIAHDRGFTDICIYLMQNSGALSFENEIEKQILESKISPAEFQSQCDQCFRDCFVYTNPKTNETFWRPTKGDVDYFISEKEIMSWGYTEKTKARSKAA